MMDIAVCFLHPRLVLKQEEMVQEWSPVPVHLLYESVILYQKGCRCLVGRALACVGEIGKGLSFVQHNLSAYRNYFIVLPYIKRFYFLQSLYL